MVTHALLYMYGENEKRMIRSSEKSFPAGLYFLNSELNHPDTRKKIEIFWRYKTAYFCPKTTNKSKNSVGKCRSHKWFDPTNNSKTNRKNYGQIQNVSETNDFATQFNKTIHASAGWSTDVQLASSQEGFWFAIDISQSELCNPKYLHSMYS